MRHFYLVGNMGSGKTTVGRLVAQRLQLPFYDLDRQIEQATGQTIANLFAQQGEQAFRELECKMLTQTIFVPRSVIATGGGVVLNERSRRLMRHRGWVIYLRASPETLWQRLQHATDRPLLRTESPSETLQAIAQAREPLYQEADWVIDTDALAPEEVADAIVRAFKPTPNAPLVIPVLPSQPNEYPVLVAPGVDDKRRASHPAAHSADPRRHRDAPQLAEHTLTPCTQGLTSTASPRI
jgi:shikimate kinase